MQPLPWGFVKTATVGDKGFQSSRCYFTTLPCSEPTLSSPVFVLPQIFSQALSKKSPVYPLKLLLKNYFPPRSCKLLHPTLVS